MSFSSVTSDLWLKTHKFILRHLYFDSHKQPLLRKLCQWHSFHPFPFTVRLSVVLDKIRLSQFQLLLGNLHTLWQICIHMLLPTRPRMLLTMSQTTLGSGPAALMPCPMALCTSQQFYLWVRVLPRLEWTQQLWEWKKKENLGNHCHFPLHKFNKHKTSPFIWTWQLPVYILGPGC